MAKRFWLARLGLLLAAVSLPSLLSAQGFQGTITVSVEDAQGASVPGATVAVKNQKTGEVRTQISTTSGKAVFPNLLVGTYTISVELTGFKKYARSNVDVRSNTSVDVPTKLTVGGIEEVITVVGGSELVKTTSSQLEGATYSGRQIVDIPVYDPTASGDVTNFAVLAPGVGTQSGGVAGQGGTIGGNRPRNNSFVVDGLDNNNGDVNGAVAVPIQDSVQEFQLITNQFAAEFGHSTAGQFITTTKSGTNQLSGGIWGYNINRHYNSLDNLTRASAVGQSNYEKPRYDRNRDGGSLGGPIVKDKLFFYGAYEYQNLTYAAQPTSEILVPTSAGLATLQNLAGAAGSGVSPINVGLLKDFVPPANTQTSTVSVVDQRTGQSASIGVGPFGGSNPSNFNRQHVAQFNLDGNFGDHRLSLRTFYNKTSQIIPGSLPVGAFNTSPAFDTKRGTLSWVWSVKNNVINELRGGYTKLVQNYPVALPKAPGTTDVFANYILNDLGLEIGPGGNYPQTGNQSVYQVTDTLTWISGAHTFKVGGEFRQVGSLAGFLPRARGEYSYESLDEFVRDKIPSVLPLRGAGSGAFDGGRKAMYGFVQDTWKIASHLTLDLGVRYEWTGVAKDEAAQVQNALANVDIRNDRNAAGQVIFNTLTPAHQELLLKEFPDGTILWQKPKSDKNNFAPRVGFAWDINGDGRSSLRGGFGMAYDVYFNNLDLLQLPPQFQVETGTDISCAISPSPGWCAIPQDQVQYSRIGFLAGGGILPTKDPTTSTDRDAARGSTGAYVPPQLTSPKTYTWSLSYQRQLGSDYVAELRYIGTLGRQLPVQRRMNAGIPDPVALPIFASQQDALSQNYAGAPTLAQHLAARTRLLGPYGFLGTVTAFSPLGESKYNGGSISISRRMSRFGFNVNYTLSKTEDNAENELFTSVINPRRNEDFWNLDTNKGLSGLDKRHKVGASFQWDLFKAQSGPLDGWSLNGAFIFETGQAFTIQSARDQNGDFDATGDRAFFNPGLNNSLGTDVSFVCYSGGRTFIAGSATACGGNGSVVGYAANDPNARWVRGQAGAQRGVGLEHSTRGAVSGPGNIHTLSLGLFKDTKLGGRVVLRLGATCNNCMNTPSFALGTGSGIGLTSGGVTSNRAYVTPGTASFLDPTIWSGSLGSSPYQRIVTLQGKLSF